MLLRCRLVPIFMLFLINAIVCLKKERTPLNTEEIEKANEREYEQPISNDGNFEGNDKSADQQPIDKTVWPKIFASALENKDESGDEESERSPPHHSHRTMQPNKRQLREIKQRKKVKQAAENEKTIDANKMHSTYEWRLACRYRKSCYASGKVPQLDLIVHPAKILTTETQAEIDHEDDEEDKTTARDLKVNCKYRTSCYVENGIELTEENEKKYRRTILAAKPSDSIEDEDKGPQFTLKDVAKYVLERSKEESTKRPVAVVSVPQHLDIQEEKLNMKNICKYRKSCYETGEIAELPTESNENASSIWDWMPKFKGVEEKVPFEEMNDKQMQVHCKYRKSCYETGQLPDLDEISDVQEEEIEEKQPIEVPLVMRCKYRKSCYETGVLPNLQNPGAPVIVEDKSEAVPVSISGLKLHCKYRKSCYAEKAELEHVLEEKKEKPDIKVKTKAAETKSKSKTNKRMEASEILKKNRLYQIERKMPQEDNQRDELIVDKKDDVKHADKASKKLKHVEKEKKDRQDDTSGIRQSKHTKKDTQSHRETTRSADKDVEKASANDVHPETVSPPKPAIEKKKHKETEKSSDQESKKDDQPSKNETVELKHSKTKKHGKKEHDTAIDDIPKTQEKIATKSPDAMVSDPNVEPNEQAAKEEPHQADKESPHTKSKAEKKHHKEDKSPDVPSEDEPAAHDLKKHHSKEKKAKEAMSTVTISDQEDTGETKTTHMPKKSKATPKTEEEDQQMDESEEKSGEEEDTYIQSWMRFLMGEDHSEEERKRDCQFRKTCYDTGSRINHRPPIDYSLRGTWKTISGLWTRTSSQPDDDHVEVEEKRIPPPRDTAADLQKLICKYRKSCYATGVLPEIDEIAWTPSIRGQNIYQQEYLEKEQNIAEEKLQCKFRKSCYNADGSVREPQKKSEKTKKIKQDDNEQPIKANPKTKEPKEESSEQEKVERDDYEQRLDCKYRKSCYQSGVLPQNLWPSSTSSSKDEIDLTAEQEELDDYSWRLKCKYRKSCYQTGKLNKELLFITNEVVDETAKEQGQSIEMKCKYRKSCYETEFLIREQQDAYVDRLVQPHVPPTEKIKEHKSSQQKKTPDSRQKTEDESDKDKKKKKSKTKPSTIDEPDESPYMQQTSPQEKAATKEKDSKLKIKDFSPRPSTIGCNPWHVSCRKAVGLPIKEKAPIGPNGRKLCRKKKVDHVAR